MRRPDFRLDEPLRPAQAFRAKCVACTGGDLAAVRNCTATEEQCHCFPYRMGRGCDRSRNPDPPGRLRAIRRECLHCMGGRHNFVRECDNVACPLHPYRLGRRPKKSTEPPPYLAETAPEAANVLEVDKKVGRTPEVPAGGVGGTFCDDALP